MLVPRGYLLNLVYIQLGPIDSLYQKAKWNLLLQFYHPPAPMGICSLINLPKWITLVLPRVYSQFALLFKRLVPNYTLGFTRVYTCSLIIQLPKPISIQLPVLNRWWNYDASSIADGSECPCECRSGNDAGNNDAGNNDAGNECWDYFRLECCWAFSTTLSIASFWLSQTLTGYIIRWVGPVKWDLILSHLLGTWSLTLSSGDVGSLVRPPDHPSQKTNHQSPLSAPCGAA